METLAVIAVSLVVKLPLDVVGLGGLFVLTPAFPVAPWTLVTSVYAHAGPVHLLGNAVVLVLVGPLVERTTSRGRYHLFFLVTGALAGLAQVLVVGTGVLGASGAVFALAGYLLAGNLVAGRLLNALERVAGDRRAELLAFLVASGLLAVALSGPNAALVGHFAGLFAGLVAGRARLLAV